VLPVFSAAWFASLPWWGLLLLGPVGWGLFLFGLLALGSLASRLRAFGAWLRSALRRWWWCVRRCRCRRPFLFWCVSVLFVAWVRGLVLRWAWGVCAAWRCSLSWPVWALSGFPLLPVPGSSLASRRVRFAARLLRGAGVVYSA
jgi:hypothetical protein